MKKPELEAATKETFAETPIDWSESPTDAIREALRLRYRLLPYIYSLAHENYRTGMPPLRPMLVAFDRDANCNRNQWARQFMLGPDLLVAPVCADVKEMEVFLPAGATWIDFWTHEKHQGGKVIVCDVRNIVTMPLFVRGGAVLATTTPTEWIEEGRAWEPLIYEVFPTGPGESVLYEDDGVSMDYEKAAVGVTTARLMKSDGKDAWVLDIGATQGDYRGRPESRDCEVRFNLCQSAPGRALISGKELQRNGESKPGWEYNQAGHCASVRLVLEHSTSTRVETLYI